MTRHFTVNSDGLEQLLGDAMMLHSEGLGPSDTLDSLIIHLCQAMGYRVPDYYWEGLETTDEEPFEVMLTLERLP